VSQRSRRIAVDAGLLTLLALAGLAIAADVPLLRPLAVLLALLLVPGGAVLTCARVDDPAGRAGIAIAMSIAIGALLAAALAQAHMLDPWRFGVLLAVPAAMLLALDMYIAEPGDDASRAEP
jgi:hypothetical protein